MCTYVNPTSFQLATAFASTDARCSNAAGSTTTNEDTEHPSAPNNRETIKTGLRCNQCNVETSLPLFRVQRFSTVLVFCSMPCYAKFSATESWLGVYLLQHYHPYIHCNLSFSLSLSVVLLWFSLHVAKLLPDVQVTCSSTLLILL